MASPEEPAARGGAVDSHTAAGVERLPTVVVQPFSDPRLDPTRCTMFRLDGHGFSRFVRRAHMAAPFDAVFTAAMQQTCEVVFGAHNFQFAFVGSDELTFVWLPISTAAVAAGQSLPFNGRTQKLTSLLAGLASVTFMRAVTEGGNPHAGALLPHFDCRVFQVDTSHDMLAALRERQVFTVKNARMMFAQAYCSCKSLHGVSSAAAVDKVAVEHGILYEDVVPLMNRMGGLLYRVPTPHSTILPNGKRVEYIRRLATWGSRMDDDFTAGAHAAFAAALAPPSATPVVAPVVATSSSLAEAPVSMAEAPVSIAPATAV